MAKFLKFIGSAWMLIGILIVFYYSGSNGGSFVDANLIGQMPSWEAFSSIGEYIVLPIFKVFVCVIPGFLICYGVGHFVEDTATTIHHKH